MSKPLTPFEKWMVKSNLKTMEEQNIPAWKQAEQLKANGYPRIAEGVITARLEYLRGEIRAERISYMEIAELQDLAEHIDKEDVELLEWAGVPEFPEEERAH